jgi:membrane-associated phospholipid phosphatase
MIIFRMAVFVAALAPSIAVCAGPGADRTAARATGWLVESVAALHDGTPPPKRSQADARELAAIVAKRSIDDIERARWWDAAPPAYRWNQIAVEEMLDAFITTTPAIRNLALLHTAIDDAMAAAATMQASHRRPLSKPLDRSIAPVSPAPAASSLASGHAAAAAAAADVLGHLLPERAAAFQARAEEAMQSRLLAGVDYPSQVSAGRAIGRKAAALAIERAKSDGFDAKWSGSVPQGPGYWKSSTAAPIAPLAGTWKPWVLARSDEFRPPAPPAFDSDAVKAALAELKNIQRTPAATHRAMYWELFGGARAYALWNETARTKLLEHRALYDAAAAARVLATMNVAYHDATIACFEAKYTYWFIRPSQLDADLKTVFPTPNHPSYPAAHACLSTAAATVLARLFPRDAARLLALAEEASASRLWAGIHYRFDVEAGVTLGRKVAEKVLARAFTN